MTWINAGQGGTRHSAPMKDLSHPRRGALPDPRPVAVSDLIDAARAGLDDFRAAPLFGLAFAALYALTGLALVQLGAGLFTWTLTLTLGFPLIAPFLAVGLYEVSRIRAGGQPPRWAPVLGVLWRERTRQIPWAGFVLLIVFLFWSFLAHMMFALFMGPMALIGPPENLATYLTGAGLAMLVAEIVLGGLVAALLFSLTVFGLPMLLDREIDLITAMGCSLRTVRGNLPVMALWAAVIAGLTFLALLPAFLGLLGVLPILGHASWHLYDRTFPDPDPEF